MRLELSRRQLRQLGPTCKRRAYKARDRAVGLTEGHAEAHEQVGHVGRRDQLIAGGFAQALALEAHAGDHAGRRRERQLERVDDVEQVLLVLLQVLAVRERQRVQHAMHSRKVPHHSRRLRPQQLGGIRILLLGHDRGARAPFVGQFAEAELGARPQHQLRAQPRQMGRVRGGGREVVEHEVSPRHRVDGVRRHLTEPQLARHLAAVGVEVHARQRTRPERQARALALGVREPVAVAREHPEVRQQVVPE